MNVKFLGYPEKIPAVFVKSVATTGILHFSDTQLVFGYMDQPYYQSVLYNELTISNSQDKEVEVLIRIDELAPNFSIITENMKNYEITEVAFVVTIGANQSVDVPFVFIPQERGRCVANLPIFVRGCTENVPYNQIEIIGMYPKAVFKVPDEIVMIPVPINRSVSYELEVTATYHSKDCKFDFTCEVEEVKISVLHGDIVFENEFETIPVLIVFSSDKILSVRSLIKLSCTCGSYKDIKFCACASDQFLATHIYTFLTSSGPTIGTRYNSVESILASMFDTGCSDFPYFCEKTDTRKYAAYMDRVCETVERWVFTQGMFCKNFFCIPDHINDVYVELKSPVPPPSSSYVPVKKKEEEVLVIVKLLMNLIGPGVKNILVSR